LEEHPDLPIVNHRLGVIEARRKNFQAADRHLQTALAAEPNNVDLLVDSGYCCYLQNRYKEAEDLYRRAYQLSPDHTGLCNNFGLLLGETGRFDEALTFFKRCNSESEAHTNLGYIMTQIGDYERARRAFLLALSLDPKQRTAAHALVQLGEHKRKQAIAASATQPANSTNPTPTEQPAPSAPTTDQQAPPALVQEGRPIDQLQREKMQIMAANVSTPDPPLVVTDRPAQPGIRQTPASERSVDAALPVETLPQQRSPVAQTVYQAPPGSQYLTAAPVVVPSSHREEGGTKQEATARGAQAPVPPPQAGNATPSGQASDQSHRSSRRRSAVVIGDLPQEAATMALPGAQPLPSEPSALPDSPSSHPLGQQTSPFGLHYNLNPHAKVKSQQAIPSVGNTGWPQPTLPLLPGTRTPEIATPVPSNKTGLPFRR
jgi:hypothetical protein